MSLLDKLTPRQQQIIRWVADGWTREQIALKLEITPRTVNFHWQRIQERAGGPATTVSILRYFYDFVERDAERPTSGPS
jgi:DNA-binding CsgD family transcriptional regulator